MTQTETPPALEHSNTLLLQAEERGDGDALAKLITDDSHHHSCDRRFIPPQGLRLGTLRYEMET